MIMGRLEILSLLLILMPSFYRWDDVTRGAVTYVGGMTDRFAFDQAEDLLGWTADRLPRGIGRGA